MCYTSEQFSWSRTPGVHIFEPSTWPLVITKIGLNYPHGITLRFVCLSCTGEKSKIRVWKKERRVLSIEVVLCHRAELFRNDRHSGYLVI